MADLDQQGWLSHADAAALRELAAGKTVLELGAWKGRSTVVLAGVADYVVSVDQHLGIEEMPGEDSLPDYLASVRELPNVAIVVARFGSFLPLLAPNRFDLVFIDGAHDYESVERDITYALLLHPKVVAFHDWDIPDVQAAAVSFFGETPDSLGGSVAAFTR